MKKFLLLIVLVTTGIFVWSQKNNGIIKGKVLNTINNEPIPFANITIEGTTQGTSSDFDGNFEIKNVEPGFRNLKVTCLGYKTIIFRDVQVTNAAPAIIQILLEDEAKELQEVTIQSTPFNKTSESPVSLRTIGIAEIERNAKFI